MRRLRVGIRELWSGGSVGGRRARLGRRRGRVRSCVRDRCIQSLVEREGLEHKSGCNRRVLPGTDSGTGVPNRSPNLGWFRMDASLAAGGGDSSSLEGSLSKVATQSNHAISTTPDND